MSLFHFCPSAAKNLSSFQLLPASLITDLLQRFFGLPLFLFPWGFQCRAAFGISPSSFLKLKLFYLFLNNSRALLYLWSYFHVFVCFFHAVCLCFFVLVFLCTARFVFVWYSYYHFITTVLPVSLTSPTNVILFRCWAQFWCCEHGVVTDILTCDCNYR